MEINASLFIQAAIYLFLLFVLKRLYFEPILALLQKREQLTVGRLGEATELAQKIADLTAQYEAKMKLARESMEAHRQEVLKRARTSADAKIHELKVKLDKKLSDYQEGLERDAKQIRAKFPSLATELKKEIVSALLTSRVVRL